MKAIKNKTTGKLSIKVKKTNPVIFDFKDPDNEDKKAKRQFGVNLRSKVKDAPLVQVSDRKLIRSGVADWED